MSPNVEDNVTCLDIFFVPLMLSREKNYRIYYKAYHVIFYEKQEVVRNLCVNVLNMPENEYIFPKSVDL